MERFIIFTVYLNLLFGLGFEVEADDETCPFPLQVNTNTQYYLRFRKIPYGIMQIRFEAKANNDVHIGLCPNETESVDHYMIVIGAGGNTYSDIRRCQNCGREDSDPEPGLVTQDEFRRFWITFDCNGNIAVGKNEETTPFLQWTSPNPWAINYLGYSTGWSSTGEFRFCKFGGEHEIVPENNELFLTCERNFFLYTNDAVYGYYCATVSTGVEGVETCFSANSKEIVSSICNYQQNCTVEASDEVFDSNCTEAQKYLRVSYVCIREPNSTSPSSLSSIPTVISTIEDGTTSGHITSYTKSNEEQNSSLPPSKPAESYSTTPSLSSVPSVISTTEANETSGHITSYRKSIKEQNASLRSPKPAVSLWPIIPIWPINFLLIITGTSLLIWKVIRHGCEI